MLIIIAILIGAARGSHPMLAVVAILYAGRKLHTSEALLSCCSGYPTRKLIIFGRAL